MAGFTTVGTSIKFVDLQPATNQMQFEVNDINFLDLSSDDGDLEVNINPFGLDMDFIVERLNGAANHAIHFDAGTDTLSSHAVNFEGIADQETGTWTPVFTNGGTEGTILATYSRSGQNVIASCNAVIAAGAASPFFLSDSSLPFPIGGITTTSCTYGSFSTYTGGTFIVGSVLVDPASTLALFLRNDGTIINGDDLLGTIEFSITYQTDN